MDIVEQTPDPVTPPVEADTSLADHEASFGRDAALERTQPATETDEDAAARDDRGRFKHRAQSQKASPEDVAQINELTKALRTKEQELAKIKPDALGGSPRLLSLKRQIKAIETELAEHVSPPAPVKAAPAAPAPVQKAPATWTEQEPTIEQFADAPDQYAAWVRALTAFDRRKEAFEASQKAETEKATADAKASQEQWTQAVQAHQGRMAKAVTDPTLPNFSAIVAPILDRMLPAPLLKAIVTHDNGMRFMYHLAQHPDQLDEFHLLADGKPPSDDFVALLQRRLVSATAQAVNTGSAAGTKANVLPRPPNPVRTGPMKTGDDLPGDESSLADHERAFHHRR